MHISPRSAARLVEHILGEDADPGPMAVAGLPERIGRYRVRRQIASGGMGIVYEAEQDSPQRIAAVKVMSRPVAGRGGVALRRFEYETRILNHPGIARIYDAGTWNDGHGDVPYFAMEYIPKARTIIEYAEGHALTRRARLHLFAKVCDAVHHGHQKGIIHRDLKPANILVCESETGETRRSRK